MRRSFVFSIAFLALAASVTTACSSTSDSGSPFSDGGSDSGVGDFTGNRDGGPALGCTPSAGSFDIPGNGCDDDNDGTVDNVPSCDTGLTLSGDADAFAKTLGLCQKATGNGWGLVSATFTHDFGQTTAVNDQQHGILRKFGNVVKPREGASLGVLSSGFAREFDCDGCPDEIFQSGKHMLEDGTVPAGFPKPADGCETESDVHDVIDLKLVIKVPNNAQGIQFDFDFWSGEWPEYVCTAYNDGFIAYLQSSAFKSGAGDNMSFDAKNNPVSVNNGFFDRCTQNATVGCDGNKSTMACAGGPAELEGTGFYEPSIYCETESTAGGATGWLTSQAPVKPGETITIDFIIWDTHDQAYDSSVLLDHLTWVPGTVTSGTQRPPN